MRKFFIVYNFIGVRGTSGWGNTYGDLPHGKVTADIVTAWQNGILQKNPGFSGVCIVNYIELEG
jgi:hypothetical protein